MLIRHQVKCISVRLRHKLNKMYKCVWTLLFVKLKENADV